MAFEVKKAKRRRRPLKISLEGLSGSGKTYTALRLAFAMRRAGIGKRIVVADSENESAGLYDGVSIDGEVWQYETCAIPHEKQNPAGYAECYEYLVGEGFDLVVFDSLSHSWHGAMEQVDQFAAANNKDKFGGWARVTPQQRHMLTTLTDPRAHCIVTMRVKSEYERTTDHNGKGQIKKVGMKADQRDNTEYEFDAVIRLDAGHEAHVEKVRGCSAMDNKTGTRPGPEFWKPLFDWWLSADPVETPDDAARRKFAAAPSLETLSAAWVALSPDVQARVAADKDRRKAELAPPAPPPATAPDPKPMPAADRRTAPPASEAGVPMAGGNIISVLLALMHELDVNWTQVRDGVEKGADIAAACGLAKMPPNARVNQLTAAEALALKAELDARVAEKKARAAKRAEGAARKAREEGAVTA